MRQRIRSGLPRGCPRGQKMQSGSVGKFIPHVVNFDQQETKTSQS